MIRLIIIVVLLVFAQSCNDHSEEITECQQCDTLINLKVDFEDTTAVNDGDTITFVLQKTPDFLPVRRIVVLQNGQKEFHINDTIHLNDSLTITHLRKTHVYTGFRKDWYFMATMFD